MKKNGKLTNKWSLERLVPDLVPWYSRQMVNDHVSRYDFACQFAKGKQVLDIACGSGYGTVMLAKAGAKQVIGIDISKETITYAQNKYHHKLIKFLTGDATIIPLPNKSVDLVVSFETLEHIDKYQKFLFEIHRVLKKDGLCIISTPNSLLNDETCNEFHVHQFSKQQFLQDLRKRFIIVELLGQKPMPIKYLDIVRKITGHLPQGFIKWFVDSGLKCMFRETKIKPIKEMKRGFVPAFYIAKCSNI